MKLTFKLTEGQLIVTLFQMQIGRTNRAAKNRQGK